MRSGGSACAFRIAFDGSSYFRSSSSSLVSFKFVDPENKIPTKEFVIGFAHSGESYDVWNDLLPPIMAGFKALKDVGALDEVFVVADLKALLCALGRKAASSYECCPFCTFSAKPAKKQGKRRRVEEFQVDCGLSNVCYLTSRFKPLTLQCMHDRAREGQCLPGSSCFLSARPRRT